MGHRSRPTTNDQLSFILSRLNRFAAEETMRFCWANYLLWAVIAVLGFGAMVSGCGAKGPLYLPEEPTPQEQQKRQ